MPKKKAGSFNAVQIKNGKIVRMYKDGRIKSIIDDYLVKHTKQLTKKGQLMDDLDKEDLKVLLSFYRQKSNDLEWQNLMLQVKLNKELAKSNQDVMHDIQETLWNI